MLIFSCLIVEILNIICATPIDIALVAISPSALTIYIIKDFNIELYKWRTF